MVRRDSRRAVCGCAVALAVVLPAPAAQAVAPLVGTGGVKALTNTSVTLTGWVDSGGESTTYQFEYGPTTTYGTATPPGTATRVKKAPVTADVTGLTSGAVYHYRLVAQNASGAVQGPDRRFKAVAPPPAAPPPAPAALTLAAPSAQARFGLPTSLSGQITGGPPPAGRTVVLQTNPWPFTQGFGDLGGPVAADAEGKFTFGGLTAPLTTQYRAVLADARDVVSPTVLVGVQVSVGLRLHPVTRVRRGQRVLFAGAIAPKADGAHVSIQRKHGATWTTVARTVARHRDRSRSTYRKLLRTLRGGTYRVRVAAPNGGYLPNTSHEAVLRTR